MSRAKPIRPIHARILKYREDRGLSQRDLALLLGIDETAVSNWERRKSAPHWRRLPAVAKALGVTVSQLRGES